jgi:DNA-binding transcriptional LysR family regulator
MEDRDWLILQELYRMKNITKAAQELYMSQPALTSRLQHIEREFNVRIVTRSTKGIRFTPEGEYLVKKVFRFAGRAGRY